MSCCLSGAALLHAWAQPVAPTDRTAPAVGVQVKVERFTSTDAFRVKAAGFVFVRFGVWVDAMNGAAGATEYRRRVSRAFDAARQAGLPVLVTVRSTSPLARAASQGAARDAQLHDAAAQLTQVVSDLVTAHRRDLLAIELWNEPDLAAYWPTGALEATFPVYMNAVCDGLQGVRKRVPLIGFGFSRAPVEASSADRLLQSLHAPASCVDAVSYHAYGMSDPQIRRASAYVRARYGLPAVMTEWGASSGVDVGRSVQAARIESFLEKRALLDTPLISLYEWQDTASGKNARERNFGLLDASGIDKPAMGAVTNAMRDCDRPVCTTTPPRASDKPAFLRR
ncbi:beta-xylosidase [Paraburkholderia sp. BCC1886]|uniref:beta-xylosidase n=1 Tax=Paraburkholderia sp. BCC1886 TaxID=2562670 RepID=UPI001182B596|nr:beta-xylosidase [Paraburkholderia sp. BCC1886]